MATVTNWIDHLSAKEVVGAVYPGAGSTETLLVILGVVFPKAKYGVIAAIIIIIGGNLIYYKETIFSFLR